MREIAIHGLGYVGLTAAVHYARAGWKVLGYDPSEARVIALNSGRPLLEASMGYVDESGTPIKELVESGALRATVDLDDVVFIPVHSVAVPTEKAGRPDDSIVTTVLTQLFAKAVRPATILIESTLTPGLVDDYFEKFGSHRMMVEAGEAFLAVCPRRDWFADPEKNLATLPRVVGGYNQASTDRASEILSTVSPQILTTDYRTAELCKALENALLHVPVMFAYQLAWAMPDRNVAEALRLAGTHWRLPQLHLGFGTGGRCVPLGTEYLTLAADSQLNIGEEALRFDEYFREAVAHAALSARPKPRSALVLGVAYRPGFRDAGRSPGLAVAKHLAALLRPGSVTIHDPLWPAHELARMAGLPALSGPLDDNIAAYDAVLLATPHGDYRHLPLELFWRRGQIVLDGQGAWAQHREIFEARGVLYRQVGEPGWTDLRRDDT